MTASVPTVSAGLNTPETYLSQEGAASFAPRLSTGTHTYPGRSQLELNQFALRGTWNLAAQSATPLSAGATITGRVQAARVYLVMTSAGNTPRIGHRAARRPPDSGLGRRGATSAPDRSRVLGQRLYSLVSLPTAQAHTVTVEVPPGVSAYDFTFG